MCPYCREPYVNFKIELLGKKARCVNCGKVFVLRKQDDEDSLIRVDFNPRNSANLNTDARQTAAPVEHVGDSQLLGVTATTMKAPTERSSSFHPFLAGDASDSFDADALKSTPALSFGDEFNEALIDEFADKFPNPPQGVWQAGEVLLNGLCQVLPLSPTKLYAEGGVGIVQRVRRRDWNVDLIVKSPKPGVITTESGKESFERECQTWIELGLHANIVSCYFVRRIDGIPRLFAEYAPDGTLRDWIADKRIYKGSSHEALARILDISIQFAWGLEHAHRQGLLHLDVKPGNVMTSGSMIKVTDFGLSKFAAEMNQSGEVGASSCEGMTPSYCSPEQYESFQLYKNRKDPDSRPEKIVSIPMTKQSDIWSWAISVLSMFHGRSPCKMGGQTAAEVFEIFLKTQEPGSRPIIPEGVVELLRWCFKKNPADRPESMQLVADRLVEIYKDEVGIKYPRRQPQNAALTAESFSNKAISLLDLGKTPEALGLLKKAAGLEPNHPLIVFNYTLALWRSGKITDVQAIKRVEELVQNRSYEADPAYVSGLLQIERGNLKSAINSFEHALELDPKRGNIRRLLPQLENLKRLDSQCLTQYVLRKPDEKTPPVLYVSENDDMLLVELVDGQYAVLNVQTGHTAMKFQPSVEEPTSTSKSVKIAVSEDYRWSLSARSDGRLTIKPATLNHNQGNIVKFRFRKVEWNVCASRSTISQSGSASRPKNASTTYFLPTPSGISVVRDGEPEIKIVDEARTITVFDVSKDGKWAATGNDVSEIKIWNVETQRCVRTFLGLGSTIEAIWLDPRKRSVVALSKGNCCQIFSVRLLCNFPEKISAPHLLCQINSSEELLERQTKFEELVEKARNADARGDVANVVGAFHEIQNTDGWETTRPVFEQLLERRAKRSRVVELTPTGQTAAHDGVVSTLATSWNGSFLVSAGKDATIRVWARDLNSNQWGQALSLDAHYDWVRSIALSPNDRFLASASWDQRVFLWDLASGKKVRQLPEHIKSPSQLAFAPDGRSLAVATANGSVTLYDFATSKPLIRLGVSDGEVHSLVFSRDGRFFVTSTDDGIQVWTGRDRFPVFEIKDVESPILSLDVSCDMSLLALGCASGKIIVASLPDGRRTTLTGHLGEVGKVKLFSDSRWLISSGKDNALRLWNLESGNEELKISSLDGEITSVALDFQGRMLFTGAENGMIRRWRLQWDYELPEQDDASMKTRKLIASLATSAALAKYYENEPSPESYYGNPSSKPPTRYNQTRLDETLIHQVVAESQYRGITGVSYKKIKKNLKDLWRTNATFPEI